MQATRTGQPIFFATREATIERESQPRTLFVHLNDGYTVEVGDVIDLQITDTNLVVLLGTGETLTYPRDLVFYAGFGQDAPPALD